MDRILNRRQQGDLGEASAIEWFTSRGALVLIPFGHSPDVDLAAEVDGRLVRIQVKTSTQEVKTPDGHPRITVGVGTCGGNQSWSGVAKKLDPAAFDYLFVLTGRGRRWLIPAAAVEAGHSITLGGPKYAEYEIEPGRPIRELVYGESAPLESAVSPGEYPSGQRMAAVNRPAQPSQVRILPPPSVSPRRLRPSKYERKLGRNGQAVINQKRRISIPQRPFFEAGFENGSRVRVRSDGPGRIVLEQIELPVWARSDPESERSSDADRED
jgi:hypothetical protein